VIKNHAGRIMLQRGAWSTAASLDGCNQGCEAIILER